VCRGLFTGSTIDGNWPILNLSGVADLSEGFKSAKIANPATGIEYDCSTLTNISSLFESCGLNTVATDISYYPTLINQTSIGLTGYNSLYFNNTGLTGVFNKPVTSNWTSYSSFLGINLNVGVSTGITTFAENDVKGNPIVFNVH